MRDRQARQRWPFW